MKARIYFDVNFLVHVLQGASGPFGLDAQTALRNVARGHAGSHVAVCCSSWQLSVLKSTLEKLNLGHVFESFVDAFIEVVDATGGVEDTVRVTSEDFRALETEARQTRLAPDGEDLGHLKSMLRMGIDVFVTDDVPGVRLTLLTCDPPGSAARRLVIQSELISGPFLSNALPASQWEFLGK